MHRNGFSSFGIAIWRNARVARRGARALSDTVDAPAQDVLASRHVALREPKYFKVDNTSTRRHKGLFSRTHLDIGVDNFTKVASQRSSRIWRFVRALAHAPSEGAVFVKTMNECSIPRGVYERFKPIIVEPSFSKAIASIDRNAPDWLLWHLFTNKVVTVEEAVEAAQYAQNLDGATDRVAGCMVLAMLALGWHGAAAPAATLLSVYLRRKEIFKPRLHFYANSMLLAVSRFEQVDVLSPLIERLVQHMRLSEVTFADWALEYFLASKSTSLERIAQVHDIILANNPNQVERVVVENYLTALQREGPRGSVAQVLQAIVSSWGANSTQEQIFTYPTENTESVQEHSNEELSVGQNTIRLPYFPDHTPPKTFDRMSTFDWISYISQVSRDTTVSGETLVSLFRLSQDFVIRTTRDSSSGIQIRRKLLPSILAGLIRRKEVTRALDLWQEYVRRHLDPDTSQDGEFLKPDKVILGAGVHTLTSAGRISEAFATIDHLALRVGEAQFTGGRAHYSFPSFDPGDPKPKPRVPLSVQGLNTLLYSLLNRRRPDVVFALWDMVERVWGVAPDARSLLCLITAALHASQMHARRPIREEMQYIRFRMRALLMPWSKTFAAPREPVAPRGSPNDPALLITALLNESEPQGTLWRGVPAWQRVRYIFRSVVLGNWPNLVSIPVPAVAVRENDAVELARSHIQTPELQSELPDAILYNEDADATSVPRKLDFGTSDDSEAPPLRYPFLIPSPDTFHVYIVLLGQVGLASEIALALAWMRALDIVPRSDTLKVALVHWRHVTDDAPSMEFYKDFISKPAQRLIKSDSADEDTSTSYGSGYMDLVRWLNEWVPHLMPTDEDLIQYEWYSRPGVRNSDQSPD